MRYFSWSISLPYGYEFAKQLDAISFNLSFDNRDRVGTDPIRGLVSIHFPETMHPHDAFDLMLHDLIYESPYTHRDFLLVESKLRGKEPPDLCYAKDKNGNHFGPWPVGQAPLVPAYQELLYVRRKP